MGRPDMRSITSRARAGQPDRRWKWAVVKKSRLSRGVTASSDWVVAFSLWSDLKPDSIRALLLASAFLMVMVTVVVMVIVSVEDVVMTVMLMSANLATLCLMMRGWVLRYT